MYYQQYDLGFRLEEMRTYFNEMDLNMDGQISREEARLFLSTMAFKEDEIDELITVYDANGDGYIQFEEFIKFWQEAR